MKKILLSLMCIALLLGTTSCKDWLDVNNSQDKPNNKTATVEVRLPWIQYYYMYAWGNAGFRTNLITQMYAMASRSATNSYLMEWDYAQDHSTTAYQNWFVGAACNIPDLIEAADAIGANHYIGAAKIIHAMGSVLMVDLFGEMPYTQASSGDILAPEYDDGDMIYDASLLELDDAIKDLSKDQPSGVTALSVGDSWFGGNTKKWIMLARLFKARMYMTMSKVNDKYIDLAMDALEQSGMSSVADNLYATYANVSSATTGIPGDAYGPNTTWDSAAWGTGQRMNRWYVKLLTQFKGRKCVKDPRAEKLLPSAMYHVDLNADGNAIKSYEWILDEGIDTFDADGKQLKARHVLGNCQAYLTPAISLVDEDLSKRTRKYPNTSILNSYESVDDFIAGVKKYYREGKDVKITVNPDEVQIEYLPGAMMVVENEPLFVEDIKYVQLRADGLFETGGVAVNDMNCYYSGNSDVTRQLGYVQGTGSFYTRPDSDNDLFTYSEACFIKAEAYFLKGEKGKALNAYRDGIQAHFDRMQIKLNEWKGKGCCKTNKGFDVSFAYGPMDEKEIKAYMKDDNPAVVSKAADLTLSDIMMQKFIAMGPNYQNWNDMRKYDYYAEGVYTEMSEPAYRPGSNSTIGTGRSFFPRRWMHSTHETNYNNAHCAQSYEKYETVQGATDKSIPYIPVFWDANAPTFHEN